MTDDGSQELAAVDPDVWRRVAETELATVTHFRNTLLEAHTDAYKWLLASLLAINSGGLFALIGIDRLSDGHKAVAGSIFLVGIMAALFSAYLNQRSINKVIAPLTEMMGYWITVAHDGDHVQEIFDGLQQKVTDVIGRSYWVQVSGWVSAFCFAVGAVVIGGIRYAGAFG